MSGVGAAVSARDQLKWRQEAEVNQELQPEWPDDWQNPRGMGDAGGWEGRLPSAHLRGQQL